MPIIKYPLSLNEEYQEDIAEIGRSIGIKDINHVRGAIPQIIKFSIKLAKKQAETLEKLIPDLDPKILDFFLSSIKIKKLQRYEALKKQKQEKNTKKV